MDVFKFNNPTAPTKMEQGQIINGLSTKTWIERYQEAGEFTFTAPADSGMREKLPIGSFVSHVNTPEVMIVENHEINDNGKGDSQITITGRGFETFFENRIIGSNQDFPFSGVISADYYVGYNYSWVQAVAVINEFINATNLLDDNNAIPYVSALHSIVVPPGVMAARAIKVGDLYSGLKDLLAVDGLGVQVIRPGPFTPAGIPAGNLAIVLHNGVDRTNQVIFSYETGEVISADYLWSNKKLRNAVMVSGKWVRMVVLPTAVGYARRMMHITADDIDKDYATAPTGTDLTDVTNAMRQRGIEALISQIDLALTKAEISKEAVKSVYRRDFFVGDIVLVSGDYNEASPMRISEYVEIEDEKGESGYPTLTV